MDLKNKYKKEEPARTSMEAIGEKPLSPILSKKRFSRKQIPRKSNKRSDDHSTRPSPYKQRNSCIPVPVKDYKDHSHHQPTNTIPIPTDINTTSSSSLTNFKQEVITKCAKSPKYLTKYESTHSGNANGSVSTSESKINKTNKKFAAESKTGSDSRMQHLLKGKARPRSPQVITQNIEVKCASGDISEDSPDYESVKERTKYIAGQEFKVRKTHLDMLYENSKFETGQFSKTTVNGSVDSDELAVKVFCNNNFHSTDSSGESVMKVAPVPGLCKSPKSHSACIKEEDTDKEQVSQLNYNGTTDDNLSGILNDIVTRSEVDDKITRQTSKNIVNVNFTPNVKEQIKNWPEDRRINGENPFFGFRDEEVRETETEYERYKATYKTFTKKHNNSLCQSEISESTAEKLASGAESPTAKVVSDKNKAISKGNTIVINGVKAETTNDSISLSPNNRVQISIAHNRIRINIKADSHAQPMKTSTDQSTTCQSTSETTDVAAIEYDTDINKFDGFKTASGKPVQVNIDKLASAKEIYDSMKLQMETTDSESKVKKHEDSYELSTSGFKSGSGNALNAAANSPRKVVGNKFFDDMSVKPPDTSSASGSKPSSVKSKDFTSAGSGFKLASGRGSPSKLKGSALLRASKLFDDLDMEFAKSSGSTNNSTPCLCISPKRGGGARTSTKRSLRSEPYSLNSSPRSHFSSELSVVPSECQPSENGKQERKILKAKTSMQRRQECINLLTDASPKSRKSLNFAHFQQEQIVQFGKIPNFNFDFKAATAGGGFTSASGKHVSIDIEKLKQASAKFDDIDERATRGRTNEEEASRAKVETSPRAGSSKTAHELIEDVVHSYDQALERLNSPKRHQMEERVRERTIPTPVRGSVSKKRIGMGKMSKINIIPKAKLEKAKFALFDDCDKNLNISPRKSYTAFNINTPKGNSNSNTYMNTGIVNTPKVFPRLDCIPMTSTPRVDRSIHIPGIKTLELTPIKNIPNTIIHAESVSNSAKSDNNSKDSQEATLVFHEKSCSNFKQLQNDIDIEYMNLKRKLEILEERKTALEKQKYIIDHCESEHKRPRPGILTIRKKPSQNRMRLRDLDSSAQDNLQLFHVDQRILEITPRNAENIHFNASKNERSVDRTLDGAIVIPNTRNTIGVTEISNAFQAMSGIDPQLIPKGWVSNHYKWIVWKLASYERLYPQYCKDFLSIENIVQQLKFRYDRDIDRASRSAIRRIMEKDDVPNKRLVLCVADVIQICNNKFELVLSDGWYAIKTVIDLLLCRHVYKKINIGTKLMIQGAELLDCEGCHPLEAPEHVKLKICYNSTRRALWDTRLGYCKFPCPFPIQLKSIHPDGGQVACIKVFLVRVYPVRFMEDHNGVKIWRNGRAEEKREREFDMERMKDLEKIKHKAYQDYENDKKNKSNQKVDKQYLNTITSPKTLYRMMEVSNDPESLYDSLSAQQKSMVMDYKLNAANDQQKEISIKIAKQIKELKLNKRNVTPVLKLLLTDALEESSRCFVLNVWRPAEEQMLMFREESCLTIYNVLMKKTNELSTVSRTMYKVNDGLTMKRAQRKLFPISMTTDPYCKPLFNEFDTVGVVIDLTINAFDQEVWLADCLGNLLYVKIKDGPKICAFIDNVKVAQTLALCNLIMHMPHNEFGQAVANQFSTITQFPSQKFLQNALEIFTNELNDVSLPKLLNDCKHKIESLRTHINLKLDRSYQDLAFMNKVKTNISGNDDSMDENASIPSRLTHIDVAMSLIDTTQFL